MEAYIEGIEKANLPDYVETIWNGEVSVTRTAPLLATFRVDLIISNSKKELFFEVREQPNGPLIDEYYEDQVFECLKSALSAIQKDKARTTVYNSLVNQISDAVFSKWTGTDQIYPIHLSMEIKPAK